MKNKIDKNLDYIQILKNAWNITWKNKFLWWFGFFIAISGGASSFRFNSFGSSESEEELSPEIIDSLNQYWSLYKEWIMVGIVILFLIAIAFYILSIIGRSGLIGSLIEINKDNKINFSVGFKKGRRLFWSFFLLNLVFGVGLFSIVIIFSFPVIRFLFMEAYGLAFVLGSIAIPIIISVFILASFLKKYSQIYLAGNNVRLFETIKLSYNLFKKNIKKSVLMGISLIIVNIIVGIIFVIALLALAVPFIVIGGVAYLLMQQLGIIIVSIIGLLILFTFSIVWRSACIVFMQSAWILFFNKIAIVPDKPKEKLAERVEEKIPGLKKA
jgi:hypothetical protein